MMRSEGEIRHEVETRLRRWGFLALNGILWVGAAKLIYGYSQYDNFGRFSGVVVLFMLGWLVLVGLHALRTIYVEGREWLVRRAIAREREFYVLQNAYEKPKRDESVSLSDDARPSLQAEDGELVDFPFSHESEPKVKNER